MMSPAQVVASPVPRMISIILAAILLASGLRMLAA